MNNSSNAAVSSTSTNGTNGAAKTNGAPKPTSTPKEPRALTSTEVSVILAAFATIHATVNDVGETFTFNDNDPASFDRVYNRATKALKRYKTAQREEMVRNLRSNLEGAFAPYLEAHATAKEEYDALSPTLKAMLPSFPTYVSVKLTDLSAHFPTGTSELNMVKMLADMKVECSKGKEKDAAILVRIPVSGIPAAVVAPATK